MSAPNSVGIVNDTSDGSCRARQQPGSACHECRRRKLRCDRQKPQCGACQTSGAACIVPDIKPARGPKRGHLKALQARITALEGALREQQYMLPTPPATQDVPNTPLDMTNMAAIGELGDMGLNQLPWTLSMPGEGGSSPSSRHMSYSEKGLLSTLEVEECGYTLPHGPMDTEASTLSPTKLNMARPDQVIPASQQTPANSYESSGSSPDVAMSSLVQSDLDQLYMDRIHVFIPIVYHGGSAADSASESRTALRYAMSTLAASTSAYHLTLRNSFYQKTRQALESLDQRGNADAVDTENVQAWLLLAVYELMCVGFRHAWISAGRAFRLIQLDPTWTTAVGSAADDNTSSPHQEYWVEAEQRRRTFWFAYCLDRFLSLRNGSSLTFSERVPVRLPCPESAFQYGESVVMGFLPDVNTMASAEASAQMSPLGECIVVATLAGHVLSHRLQATASSASGGERQDTQQNNDFWDRHTWLDSLVAHRIDIFAMNHPPAAQERDPMLLFLAMEWHAAELYLWHTAESMSAPAQDQNRAIHAESSQRVEKAAREMIRLMSKLSELNSWKIHPLMSIPLTLGAELLSSRSDLLEEFTQKLKEITQATHGLRLFS